MPIDCQRSTSGGKGNLGMFTERDPTVCAAGIPSSQPDVCMKDVLQHYLLKDEVDALISDALIPSPKPRPIPPLRHSKPVDTRNAGPFGDVPQLVNPPMKTKFQALVCDLKDTVYTSYWKKGVGCIPDPVPMLPGGYDIYNTSMGIKTLGSESLYDVVMPKEPYPDKIPVSKQAGVQTNRNYCSPPFNRDLIYGHRTFLDKRGVKVKCCLTDDRIILGNKDRSVITTLQANFQQANQSRCGTVLAPNDNITCVPEGYTFGTLKPPGNLPECLSNCELNPGRDEFKNCLKALNTLRKCMRSKFLPSQFNSLYLSLKYFDKDKTGWLPKDVVYKFCLSKFIRFDPELIEPLLSMWYAFDGSNIEYKIFIDVINYTKPSPEMPKVPDIRDECLDFNTTYRDMVKPDKEPDIKLMAGLPSGRYFDKNYPVTPSFCCEADRICLPQESDIKASLNPSVYTLCFINHRDMYQKREPEIVRRVFEAAYEKFTDEHFNAIWEAAKKYHSQGWVCYETFKRALEKITNPEKP